ncbi:MAG: CAP domain-containing protein [Terriglobales bacterium]
MKTAVLTLLLLLIPGSKALAAGPQLSDAEQRVFQLTNEARKEAGIDPLTWNEQAAQAARVHAKIMAEKQALSHQFSGEAVLRDRLGAVGLRFDSAAENVADAESADEAHDALMHSPPHRTNLLNPKYNSLGIGVAENSGQLYVVEDFAHAIPEQSFGQVEDEIISDFNRLRASHGLPTVETVKSEDLRKLACSGKQGTVRARDVLVATPTASRVFAFTVTDPSKLPDSLLQASHEAARRMNIGACFAPSQATSYAAFWVVVTMYR